MNDPAPEQAPSSACSPALSGFPIVPLPEVRAGDDLAQLVVRAVCERRLALQAGDIFVVTSKVVSKAEGRQVDLSTVEVGPEAKQLASELEKEPALVQLVLNESAAISRAQNHALIVRHKLGLVSANAAIDQSNALPPDAPAGSGPWALLLPEDPDASAQRLRQAWEAAFGVELGVVLSDSLGRPFRLGTVGAAVGVSGLDALKDYRGLPDRDGREMVASIAALADQVAAVGDLVAGQGAEGTPVCVLRGVGLGERTGRASLLYRDPETDLYV